MLFVYRIATCIQDNEDRNIILLFCILSHVPGTPGKGIIKRHALVHN